MRDISHTKSKVILESVMFFADLQTCIFGFGIDNNHTRFLRGTRIRIPCWLEIIWGFLRFLLPSFIYLLSPETPDFLIEAEGEEDEDSLEIVEDEVDVGEGEDACKGFTQEAKDPCNTHEKAQLLGKSFYRLLFVYLKTLRAGNTKSWHMLFV